MKAPLFTAVLLTCMSGAGAYGVPDAPAPDLHAMSARQINTLFGEDRQDTLNNDFLLKDAINLSMGNPAPNEVLTDGTILIHGCRPHSCIEKSATIMEGAAGRVLAAGLLHFNCRLLVREDVPASNAALPDRPCRQEPTLEVFIIRRSDTPQALARETGYLSALRQWGRRSGYEGESVHVKVVGARRR